MGRRVKPTKLKIAEGNPGKRPLPVNEVNPTGKVGEPASMYAQSQNLDLR